MDLQKLIAALQAATNNNVTINVTVTEPVDNTPVTDFNVGDRVFVCHTKKDGTGTIHTWGTVSAVCQQDEIGWYTRVDGDNGKHYRTGLVYDEERLGSKIVNLDGIDD